MIVSPVKEVFLPIFGLYLLELAIHTDRILKFKLAVSESLEHLAGYAP